MADYLLDIVILLTAAVLAVPLLRAAGFCAVPGFLVAIDYNSSLVLRERASGHRIHYGDVRRPEVLRAVGIADATLVIVTLDDFEAAEDVVAALHQVHPNITILVRGHNSEQCRTLRGLGASLLVSENLEASLVLAREALIRDDGNADQAETLILRFRDEHYAEIDGELP